MFLAVHDLSSMQRALVPAGDSSWFGSELAGLAGTKIFLSNRLLFLNTSTHRIL